LKLEGRKNYRNPQNVDKKGNFRRPNNAPQILPREKRNKDRNDQNIQTPLQNNPPPFFNFDHEIQKIRIPVPLSELVKHEDFKRSLSKLLQSEPKSHSIDSVNLQYENPIVILGPLVEDRDDSSPPFYTSLNIHDKVLHNYLMDSGASHNVMPKTIMDEIGLEITKAYHDLYYFDSSKVKCLGVIKDLVLTLFQFPMKSVVMDIMVADVPPKFGMLLSRS
jgi:hypothetical protein